MGTCLLGAEAPSYSMSPFQGEGGAECTVAILAGTGGVLAGSVPCGLDVFPCFRERIAYMSRLLLVLATLFLALAPPGLQAAESPTVRSIGALEITVLPRPSFDWPGISKETGSHALRIIDAKPNKIADDKEWFERNGLELPRFDLDNLPDGILRTFQGGSLVQALYDWDSTLLLYGKDYSGARYVVAQDPKTGSFRYAFDFANFLTVPGLKADDLTEEPVTWAAEEGGFLYVSNGHRTYAASSKGRNAYLTAINVKTRQDPVAQPPPGGEHVQLYDSGGRDRYRVRFYEGARFFVSGRQEDGKRGDEASAEVGAGLNFVELSTCLFVPAALITFLES